MKKLSFLFIILSVFFVCSCTQHGEPYIDNTQAEPELLYTLTITPAANGQVTPSKTDGIKPGEEVFLAIEPNQGYELKDLSVVTELNNDIAVAAVSKGILYKFTMPISNVTVNSEFAIRTITEDLTGSATADAAYYKIEHWLQAVDDLETYELAVIQTKSGNAGEETSAAAKDYPGFNVLDFSQKIISENGNTVVKIFYDRKTITYTFDPNGGNWDGDTSVKIVSGLYGAVVPMENPKKAGYDLAWDKPLTVFGFENETFSANWTARNDTRYTVEIYEQNLEGGDNYTLVSTVQCVGVTDTNTCVVSNQKFGFISLPVNQVNISSDGESVVKVYYNRRIYKLNIHEEDGSIFQTKNVLYGSSINLNEITKPGFYVWKLLYDYPYKYTVNRNNSYFSNNFFFNEKYITQKNQEEDENIDVYAKWVPDTVTYKFHDTITRLPKGTDGTIGTDGDYVLFGDYPQSSKLREVTVNYEDEDYLIFPNELVRYGDDGNFYAYRENARYHFKIEPIKWRIISEDTEGKVVLLAENILESVYYKNDEFYHVYNFTPDNFKTENFSNNIEELYYSFCGSSVYSSLLLFYTLAFDFFQNISILPMQVMEDTYLDSIHQKLISDNCVVYITSMMHEDLSGELFPNDESRIRRPTKYVSLTNKWNEGPWFWWSSTAVYSDSQSRGFLGVTEDGSIDFYDPGRYLYQIDGQYEYYRTGIVPVITVYLPD